VEEKFDSDHIFNIRIIFEIFSGWFVRSCTWRVKGYGGRSHEIRQVSNKPGYTKDTQTYSVSLKLR